MSAGEAPSPGSKRQRTSGLAGAELRHRYGLLLALISASLAFQLAAPAAEWSRFVTSILQGATLLLALWTARVTPPLLRVAAIIVGLALTGSAIAVLSSGDRGTDSTALVNLLLIAMAPTAIVIGLVRNVRADQGVTLATMFGVLCMYLLLGMFFAFLYGAIDVFGTSPLFAESSSATPADVLYYSFTTLTTTGFGDLTVEGGVARAATIIEALVGQIYLVTVVAAIVSNLRPRQPERRRRRPGVRSPAAASSSPRSPRR